MYTDNLGIINQVGTTVIQIIINNSEVIQVLLYLKN